MRQRRCWVANTYMCILVLAAAAAIAQTIRWEVPPISGAIFVGLLWASSLSVINLRRTVVVLLLPVMMTPIVKYDPGTTALIAAIGSMSLQEMRILWENNRPDIAVLKFLTNRALTAISSLAASAVMSLLWASGVPELGNPWFLLAVVAAATTWILVSGFLVNIHIVLADPQRRLMIDPAIALGSINSVAPSSIMGIMTLALYEYGGLIPFAIGVGFFISNKNFTQRALIQKENAEEINIALARIIDSKDHYTGGHSERVAILARKLAEACRLPRTEIEEIEYVARLHDIGKVNLSDEVLTKPGRLTDEEYQQIKKHPVWGAELIRGMEKIYGDKYYRAILEHHERYDGTGYPYGKKGNEICLWARILSICDSYDAMTSERVYKHAVSDSAASQELVNNSGKQFDPALVRLFLTQVQE